MQGKLFLYIPTVWETRAVTVNKHLLLWVGPQSFIIEIFYIVVNLGHPAKACLSPNPVVGILHAMVSDVNRQGSGPRPKST